LWTGTPVTHDLQIDLLGEAAEKQVDVKMVQRPLLPRWAPKLLVLLALLLAVAAGIGVWSWYKHRPQPVPSVLNQPVDLAVANLNKAGFKGVPINAPNARVTQGIVFRQNPPAGAHRHPGTVIAITISSGAPRVSVGNLSLLTQRQAVATLSNQGLKARVVLAPSTSVPAGFVATQAPGPATVVPIGTPIEITVSSGAKAPPKPTTGRTNK
jgi:beta-lactam-binding protein with PASTA domain